MNDPGTRNGFAEPQVSPAPILVCAGIAVVAALPWFPYALAATLPLGFLAGFLIYGRMRSNAYWNAAREHSLGLARRVEGLEQELAALRAELRGRALTTPPPVAAAPQAAPAASEPAVSEPPIVATREPASAQHAEPRPAALAPATTALRPRAAVPVPSAAPRVPAPPAPPSAIERAFAAAKDWLLGGNTVARVGLLVLFVGVAFLLRYVAERTQIPIEVRLLGVAVGALVFLVLGWRLREKRPGFAITLQGGAIGILYLTVFATMRLYGVLPALGAFGLMAVLAALSGALAVMQNARALAALGAVGGFLAPILISTGEGRMALLFSYYLLLNLGVLGVARFRAWRELNWIGFVFTFGVSGLWAVRRYTPEDFLIGQGFLAAFWLLFLVVSLLYALRQAGERRGLFDTTLVFTLPLAAFGIQTRFTEGPQLALAATVAAGVYLGVSTWLLRRHDKTLQLLTEACFALGVGFLTLAIPLAASAQWTAAAWALEGLALVWVGLRQQRVLPFAAGLLLHLLGAFSLLHALERGAVSLAPKWSGLTVNLLVFSACAFAVSALMKRAAALPGLASAHGIPTVAAQLIGWAWAALLVWQPLPFPWYVFAWCALALGLLIRQQRAEGGAALSPEWIAGVTLVVLAAIASEARMPSDAAQAMKLVLRLAVAATAVAAALLSLRSAHPAQRFGAAALLTLGVLVWLLSLLAEVGAHVDAQLAVAQVALLLIGVTAAALGGMGARLTWDWPQRLAHAFFAAHLVFAAYVVGTAVWGPIAPSRHFGGFAWPLAWILFYFQLGAARALPAKVRGGLHVAALWLLTTMVAAELALRVDPIAGDGWFHAVWGGTLAAALWICVQRAHRAPMSAAPGAYASFGVPGLAAMAAAWLLWANGRSGGDPAPLPALPLVNPLDVASLGVLAAAARWHLMDARAAWRLVIRLVLAAAAFFVVNVLALRAIHFIAEVPWSADALGRSLLVQAVLSLLWTVTAMTLMVIAHRRALRPLWVAGATLLAVVVAKLFFVDLSAQGTIERIVSFVGVGLLILAIGYLAPVPPAARMTEVKS
jgi:uncharacterized membrane protein